MPAPLDPASAHPTRALVDEFAAIAAHVHSSEDYEDSMRRITDAAVHAVEGCEVASLSLLEKSGPVTHAATGPLADEGDQIQYQEKEGPCLDAAMQERWVYTRDLKTTDRWPRSAARLVSELGVASMFSCRLALEAAPNATLGGINMYATKPDAFSEQDQMLAILLSSLGAVVVDASRQQANLRAAIESRQLIGEAIGIMRSQRGMSREDAFAALSKASQRMNVKLRDLAEQIADGQPLSPEAKLP
jgi:transcriptional regulator with GAF, ATPase, and Fis domain